MKMRRIRNKRSYQEILELRKQKLQHLKKIRQNDSKRSVRYFTIGTARYINKDNAVNFVIETQVNNLVNICLDNDIDQLDFNHMANSHGMDISCFCMFSNVDKKFYIQPLIISNRTDENKDADISLVSLISKSMLLYFEEKSIEIKVFNSIWLPDIINKILEELDDFMIDFKVRSGKKSFFITTLLSHYSCTFAFEFGHRDAWFSSLQTDLRNIFVKFTEWSKILYHFSESSAWSILRFGTSFPCSNIAVWRRIVDNCDVDKEIYSLDKDCSEMVNLNKLFKLTKFAKNNEFQFRNSVKIGYKRIQFLGVPFNKQGDSLIFLSLLKSLDLLREFEEDTAFVLLTNA